MSNLAESALAYARNGWKVIPLHSPTSTGCSCGEPRQDPPLCKIGKHPRIASWQTAASYDVSQVEAWWTQWPDANIGLTLEHLLVLDVDPRNGGLESLAELEAEHGSLENRSLQQSGGSGMHYLFAPLTGFQPGKKGPEGLDFLTGKGKYICVEPSLHDSGGVYTWQVGPDPLTVARESIALTPVPQWLADASKGKATGKVDRKKPFILPEVIAEGGRDNILTSYAGSMRRSGSNEGEIVAAIKEANHGRCNPPLPDSDITRIAKSVATKYPAGAGAEDVGPTRELADAITANVSFARDPGGMLYVFEGGVYKPTGKRYIERKCLELCDAWGKSKAWSPELASRVEARVAGYSPELWERPPLDTLNVLNGLLDVETKALGAHDPKHLSPVQFPITFDPAATCPNIDRFVADVFPHDSQHLAWELAAWLMLPNGDIQKALLAIGQGSNGKSVFLSLLQAFIGSGNVSALSLHKIGVGQVCSVATVG